jgi:hypothetical protein
MEVLLPIIVFLVILVAVRINRSVYKGIEIEVYKTEKTVNEILEEDTVKLLTMPLEVKDRK